MEREKEYFYEIGKEFIEEIKDGLINDLDKLMDTFLEKFFVKAEELAKSYFNASVHFEEKKRFADWMNRIGKKG